MLSSAPLSTIFKNTPQALPRAPLPRKACVTVKAGHSNSGSVKAAFDSLVKPASLTAFSSLALVLPAYADAGKLFDFNLTLPIMAVQFLLLMVFLDKTWFTPVGEILEKRDQVIRDQLANVSSNSGEIDRLEKEAEELLKKARIDAQAALNKSRSENEAKAAALYGDAKSKSDAEIAASFENLEREKASALQSLESQVDVLAEQILLAVLPQGIVA